MKLKQITLKDFKGIKEFKLDAQGQSMDIRGDNGTGKTSIFDAFTWLLFDKDSLDRKEFGIKPIGENGQVIHGAYSTVQATLDIDGIEAVLNKAYKETFTKKRGQAEATFTGHSVDYWIDGVPAKKNEYDAHIANLINENIFKLLTNPRHFNEVLHWQKRREHLLELCGTITDEEVIATNEKLAELPKILGNKSIEDHHKVVKAKQTEINKELNVLPIRLDEAHKALPEVPEKIDETDYQEDLQRLQEKRSGINAGGDAAEMHKQLAEIDAELLQVKNQQSEKIQGQLDNVNKKGQSTWNEIQDIEHAISTKRRQSASILEEMKLLEQIQAKRREEYKRISEENFPEADTCPTCKQPLPTDQVEEAKKAFNKSKAENLENINRQGKDGKAKLESLKAQDLVLTREINDLSNKLPELREQKAKYEAEINNLKTIDIERLPEYQEVLAKKKPVLNALDAYRKGNTGSTEEIDKQIEDIRFKIASQESLKAIIKQREQGLNRIKELEAQQKELSKEYERLQKELYLTELFNKAKDDLVNNKVNGMFSFVSFRLTKELINGGIEPCCDILHDGVPYTDLSNSERIKAGLDVIRVFGNFYGIQCPVFIDNREAIVDLPDMGDIQVISLIVSSNDKRLRIEPVNKKEGVLV